MSEAVAPMPANGQLVPAKRSALADCPTATPEVIDALLLHLEDGKTLRQFCIVNGVGRRTVYDWMDKDPTFRARVEQARRIGEEAILQEMIEIADTPSTHPYDVQHRKLQLWMREKRLIWSNPSKYGQKAQLQHEHRESAKVAEMTEVERAVRVRQILEKAGMRVVEIDEPTQVRDTVRSEEASDAQR